MKNTKRKGFTIVELVIVIAVIAILAAVLIPTFASLVKKANVSADEQAVKQMNTALKIYEAENGKPTTIGEVKSALDKNLINAESLIPVTQQYAFYWNPDKNEVVLVGVDGKKTTPDEGWLLLSTTGFGIKTEIKGESALADLKKAISDSSNAEPAIITLTTDISLSNETLEVGEGKVVVIDLNDKKITKDNATYVNSKEGKSDTSIIKVSSDGTLTLKNGTLGDEDTFNVCVLNEGGDVTLNNMKMDNKGEGTLTRTKEDGTVVSNSKECYPVVKIDGLGNTSIVGCTLKSVKFDAIATNSSKDESDGSRLSVIDSKLTGKWAGILITTYADVTIDGCTIVGEEHGAFFRGCNAKISNSTIYRDTNSTDANSNMAWGSGNSGPLADITFACGGDDKYSDYAATVNYTCSNVTKDGTGKCSVIVHRPTGGTVNVSGIDVDHTCYGAYGTKCTGDNTCTCAE